MDLKMVLLPLLCSICLRTAHASYFTGVETRYIHENEDSAKNIWYITAYCYVRYTYAYTCYYAAYYSCGYYGWDSCLYYVAYTCYAHAYADVVCNECYINSDSSNSFQISASRYVQKKECVTPGCGPVCNGSGCLNGPATHTVGVTCYNNQYETVPYISTSFDVNVKENSPPSFYYSDGNKVAVKQNKAVVGTVLNSMIATDSDAYIDGDYVRYKMNASNVETPFALDKGLKSGSKQSGLLHPDESHIVQSESLICKPENTVSKFQVTGQVYMNESIRTPYIEHFTMTGCVYDRRLDLTCSELNITFYRCYETPTCEGQSKIITSESYTSGDALFEVSYSDPAGTLEAASIRTFSIESTTLETIQLVNQSGIVVLTENLTVWPNYPFVQHMIVLRINNSESCNSSTCTMSLKVYNSTFKNSNISITNMDRASVEVYDNTTGAILLFAIETSDDNGPDYDSATCSIVEGETFPPNSYKFAVVAVNVSEYAIFTVKNPSFDYNITEQYRLAVECKDEDGSSDYALLTVNILFSGNITTSPNSSISSGVPDLPSSATSGVSTSFTGVAPSVTLVNSTLSSSASTNAMELSYTETIGMASTEASTGASEVSASTTSGESTAFTSVVPSTTLEISIFSSSTGSNTIELSFTETVVITLTEASTGASELSSGVSLAFISIEPSTAFVNSNLASSASTNVMELSYTETIAITSTEANAAEKSSSSKGGMIAGIVVGVLAVVGAVIAAAGILLYKKNMIGPSNNTLMELEPDWQGKETAPEPRNQKFKMKPKNIVHPDTGVSDIPGSSSC